MKPTEFCLLFSMFACLLHGKRQFTEEEIEMAKNSGLDINTISEDTVFITPPKLSDEEQGSKFMPAAYRCDGCKAVAYQLKKKFAAEEKKKKKGDLLSEAEMIDAVEQVCDSEFENYGLKNLGDIKILAGEGLAGEKMSGMIQAGGIWKERLQNICKSLAGKWEEEVIYRWYSFKDFPFDLQICQDYCEPALKMKQPAARDDL